MPLVEKPMPIGTPESVTDSEVAPASVSTIVPDRDLPATPLIGAAVMSGPRGGAGAIVSVTLP